MSRDKENPPVVRLTEKDFRWDYFRASGNGGQHRNKTSNACRCTHEASGSVGVATESRSQRTNRETAFMRCTTTETFKEWVRVETLKKLHVLDEINARLDRELSDPSVTVVEVKDEKGRWVNGRDSGAVAGRDNRGE